MADEDENAEEEMDMAAAMADMGDDDDPMAAAMADDPMAAAMGDDPMAEAMGLGDNPPEDEGELSDELASSRVLNQDEIDSLLGFDDGAGDGDGNTGINAILDKALMAYERLPMLEVVFDRLVRMMSTNMRNFLSDNVDVSIDSMTSLRFGDYLNSIPLPALIFVFKAQEWENFGLVTVDSSLIYSTVDVLLGGRRTNRPVRIEGRPYTTIEQELVKNMVDVALADMSASFDPISPVTFQIERLETNPRFATIARPGNAAILIRLRIDMEERGGNLEILFPHATLEPIRDLLMQMFMGEKFGRDSVWESHLGHEVRNTDICVEAVLNEKTLKLGDVMNFEVGNTILLDARPEEDVMLRCKGINLMAGSLGRIGDNIAVKIKRYVHNMEDG